MAKPDLIHVIFNGGTGDESQGTVSLRQRAWLLYTWGEFSGHHANGDAGVVTLGISDSDFRVLLAGGDDASAYHGLANWDHVVQLLTCPAFHLAERIRGHRPRNQLAAEVESGAVELLAVVKGKATERQVRKLEAIVRYRASDICRIGEDTDVLFHHSSVKEARKQSRKLEKLALVQSVAVNDARQ